jgi:hypothetical protein
VAGLQARLADAERRRDEAREQLAAERALRVQQAAGDCRAATRSKELKGWQGLRDDLKEQLKVRRDGHALVGLPTELQTYVLYNVP